jgi:hypothetical protein
MVVALVLGVQHQPTWPPMPPLWLYYQTTLPQSAQQLVQLMYPTSPSLQSLLLPQRQPPLPQLLS